MKLKDDYRLRQPVRIGWRCAAGFSYETITGTVRLSATQWFDFSGKTLTASSEEECRLMSAAEEGVPLLDITTWEIGWLPDDERIIRFVAEHNPGAAEGA